MEINTSSLRPLVLAAMTLLGGYAEASDRTYPSLRAPIECAKNDMESMRGVMSGLINGWTELEGIYTRLLRQTMETEQFDTEAFGRVAELLSITRGLEVSLKAVTPPQSVSALHMDFRRAVAKTRARLSELDSIYRQSSFVPHYVDTKIDLNGLKALADLSTVGLAKIA
ncbi:hypothetical protein K0038_00849 [Pseudomonas syringae]|uniref:hypothetical protein n=1 Tax=Pseudomonas syringae TaxID=317 RepID=UPI001CA99159|nr:hypothetical protein [Pseudomonas syringae]MCI3943848.1 hypothetical protein [Pseudomonas syringae]